MLPDQDGTRPQGKAYRTDCSGLVSMAWHLSDAPNTDVFANSTTDTRWITLTGPNNGADAMRPGDGMVYRHEAQNEGHIEIFARWKNPARHTDGAWVYSFNSNGATVRWPNANSNFGNLGFDTWSEITGYDKYIKYRYILEDTAVPPPSTAPAPGGASPRARDLMAGAAG